MSQYNETIYVHFDPGDLPAWARRYPAVVALAERDLAYRCDVCSADTSDYRKFLVRLAKRTALARANR